MKITRRPATDADREYARDAHHRGYRDTVVKQFGTWDEAAQDGFFEHGWKTFRHEILLCDGVPCGYVAVSELPGYIHVIELVVHADFQGRGIGSTFLREVVAAARTRGVPVKLGVLHKNRAFDFYRKLGFRETGRTSTHILMEHGGEQAM